MIVCISAFICKSDLKGSALAVGSVCRMIIFSGLGSNVSVDISFFFTASGRCSFCTSKTFQGMCSSGYASVPWKRMGL